MVPHFIPCGLLVLALTMAPLAASAEEAAPAASTQATEAPEHETPPALEIARSAAAHLESLSAFRFDATTVYDVVQDSGQKLQFSDRRQLTIRRPDRAQASYMDDHGSSVYVYYDGETLTRYDRNENVFGVLEVPNTLDDALDYLELELGTPLPLADLLYSDLSHLGSRATESEIVGVSLVAGVYCDHLAFRNEDIDWQIWVERGDTPWFRKIVIDYKNAPGRPQFAAFFLSWDDAPEAGDPLFVFGAPLGAQRISTIALPARGQAEPVEIETDAEAGEEAATEAEPGEEAR